MQNFGQLFRNFDTIAAGVYKVAFAPPPHPEGVNQVCWGRVQRSGEDCIMGNGKQYPLLFEINGDIDVHDDDDMDCHVVIDVVINVTAISYFQNSKEKNLVFKQNVDNSIPMY